MYILPVDNYTPGESYAYMYIFFYFQRYFVNDAFFKKSDPSAPVFLMIGGEGKANPVWMTAGAWIDYAKEFGALCLMLEHRYYGKSHPTM